MNTDEAAAIDSLHQEAELYPEGTILRRGDGNIYEVINRRPVLIDTRKGEWNMLQGGKVAYIQDLGQDEFNITDIAHSLSMQCRWNGWTSEFYSVAQHSTYVGIRAGQIAEKLEMSAEFVLKCKKAGHMHDCGESMLGDLITPVKQFMPLYYTMEDDVVTRIDVKYPFHYHEEAVQKIVKRADIDLLFIERDALIMAPGKKSDPFGCEQLNLGLTFEDLNPYHTCWSPEIGKQHFLEKFEELYNDSK